MQLGALHVVTPRRRTPGCVTNAGDYWTAFDRAAIGIAEMGRDGTLLMVNAALCAMLGYESEDLHKRTFAEITHPDDRAEDERSVADLWSGTIQSCQREERCLRLDGTSIWVRITSSLAEAARAGVPCRIAIVENVTERRWLEEQAQQSGKMETIGRLAAGIAHDINNLLTAIIGYADLLEQELRPENPGRKDLKAIQDAAGMGTALTSQLLAFSRKQALAPRVVDLNLIVRTVGRLLARILGDRITLVIRPGPALTPVCVDPGQMEQVLLNLAVNARDAMHEGGTLTIETANTVLDTHVATTALLPAPGRYVRLSVSDTGSGMTPEVQARIFEPLFTTKEMGRGTGLGLSTVHGIIKQCRGHIRVSSQPGKGCSFDIYLPPADAGPVERDGLSTDASQ